MKKILITILLLFITIVETYFITINNLQITNVEKTETGELITINNNNYYYEY